MAPLCGAARPQEIERGRGDSEERAQRLSSLPAS